MLPDECKPMIMAGVLTCNFQSNPSHNENSPPALGKRNARKHGKSTGHMNNKKSCLSHHLYEHLLGIVNFISFVCSCFSGWLGPVPITPCERPLFSCCVMCCFLANLRVLSQKMNLFCIWLLQWFDGHKANHPEYTVCTYFYTHRTPLRGSMDTPHLP